MDTKFSEKLIKGKIAEIIFGQMFRDSGKYTVIPFGFENIMPELINCGKSFNARKVKKNISDSPDFVLISRYDESIFIVEVKYRSEFSKEEFIDIAQEQKIRWHPSWIFVATRDGFYFDSCTGIIKNNGNVVVLEDKWIEKGLQEKYLKLLKKYER